MSKTLPNPPVQDPAGPAAEAAVGPAATAAARPPAAARLRRGLGWLDQPRWLNLAFTIPLTLLLVAVVVFPFAMNLKLSFSHFAANSGLSWWDAPWAGFENYTRVLDDGRYWSAILRTFLITGLGVAIEGVLGFALALLMSGVRRGRTIYTAIFLIPMMVVPVVSGFVFYMMFQQGGVINAGILSTITGTTVNIPWLSDSFWAFVAILLVDVWQWTPLMFLIFSAGLAAIPDNMRNAAELLGANRWQQLRYINLPLLKRIILIAAVIRGIELFKIFDTAWILTGGGPGTSTETISIYLYRTGAVSLDVATAAASSFLVLILVGVVAWFALRPLEVDRGAAR
jgi:multiple sugar transport system permease protein